LFNTHLCRAVQHYTMGDRPKNPPPAFLLFPFRLPKPARPTGPSPVHRKYYSRSPPSEGYKNCAPPSPHPRNCMPCVYLSSASKRASKLACAAVEIKGLGFMPRPVRPTLYNYILHVLCLPRPAQPQPAHGQPSACHGQPLGAWPFTWAAGSGPAAPPPSI
jgi:hypothetical protein